MMDKLAAIRDRMPHLVITAPDGFTDPKTERLAYAVAKYSQAVEASGQWWQSWDVVRDLICAGLACPPNTADACLNELCKQGKFEQRDGKIKIRLDNSL